MVFNKSTAQYCIPNYATGTGDGDFISLVQLEDINNITVGSASPFYTYYSSLSTDLTLGSNFTITVGSGTYTSGNNISVWIDLNQNGTFESSEKLGNVTILANSTGTINFTVPANAVSGTTRMRVREAWNEANMDACTGYAYGETEDYSVNLCALPVANCKNTTVQLDLFGNASISVSDIDNGSAANCGLQSLAVSPNTFTSANLGANTVTLTVTDNFGQTATCNATVTVIAATPANWDCNCANRKLIQLDNSAAALTDYQIRIDINHESEMNADFSDIRFTASDGLTPLDYWIETYQSSTSAVAWVKVPLIPASGSAGIYMYFGGCGTVTTGNPNNVFVFYDDFSTFTGWTNYGSGTVIQNTISFSYAVGQKSNNNDPNGAWKSIGSTIDNFRLITREQRPAGTTGGGLNRYGVENNSFNGYTINRSATTSNIAAFGYERRTNGGAGNSNQVNLAQPNNNWYRTELLRCLSADQTQAFLFADDRSLIGNTTAGSIPGYNYSNFDRVTIRGGNIYYIDFMAVAKYTCNEPTVSIGSKETQILATASITSNNSPICGGEDAIFNISGTNGATVTYSFDGGITTNTVVLVSGTATVTVTNATSNQTLNLISVSDGTCLQSLSGSSTVIVNPLPTTGNIIPD